MGKGRLKKRCGLESQTNFLPFKKSPKTECRLDSGADSIWEYTVVEFCHSIQNIEFMSLRLILQVLVSIQSLILVPEPYFNEPGYEILLGTVKGKRCSQSYNEEVLLQTVVHAMVAQLKKPSSGFEDVIRTHFWIKKKRILTVWSYNTCCLSIPYNMVCSKRDIIHGRTWW